MQQPDVKFLFYACVKTHALMLWKRFNQRFTRINHWNNNQLPLDKTVEWVDFGQNCGLTVIKYLEY